MCRGLVPRLSDWSIDEGLSWVVLAGNPNTVGPGSCHNVFSENTTSHNTPLTHTSHLAHRPLTHTMLTQHQCHEIQIKVKHLMVKILLEICLVWKTFLTMFASCAQCRLISLFKKYQSCSGQECAQFFNKTQPRKSLRVLYVLYIIFQLCSSTILLLLV